MLKSLKLLLPLAAFATFLFTVSSVRADVILYATENANSKLVTVNLTTNMVSDFHLVPGAPDSIILTPGGKFIYDINDPIVSQVRIFDPVANTDTLLAGPAQGINSPQDMVLDPGGSSVLVSNFLGNSITRTTICPGSPCPTVTLANIARPEGLAYDAAGSLFVLAGGFGGVAQAFQMDPSTGAILKTSAAFDPTNSLDGLVYDSFSRLLYASSQLGNALYSVDPNTLVATKVATVPKPDGVTTDSHGLLYIASRDSHVYSFNVLTNSVTQLTSVPSIDDLAAVTVALTPPVITKSFALPQIAVGGTTAMTFMIANSNSAAVTGINFVDTLPAGINIAAVPNITGSCGGGTITAVAGATSVSLAGATLPAAVPPATTSCTFSVDVVAVTPGPLNNCVTVLSGNAGSGIQSCASLTVLAASAVVPPSLTKAFSDSQLQLLGPGSSTSLSFTITNPAANPIPLAGLAFSDMLPAGLIVSTPNGLTGSCGGGTITAVAGSNSISLSGATLVPGASCTFSLNVTAIAIGVQDNTTSPVTSTTLGAAGLPATASTSVNDLFFLWFFAG